MDVYHRVAKEVEPKKAKLAEANTTLTKAMSELEMIRPTRTRPKSLEMSAQEKIRDTEKMRAPKITPPDAVISSIWGKVIFNRG